MGDIIDKVGRSLYEFYQNVVSIFERILNITFRVRGKPVERRRSSTKKGKKQPTLDEFAKEIEQLFTGHLSTKNLIHMSKQIQAQLDHCAKTSPVCMLPSFNYALPTGKEQGTFLALDVGGSTFRMALVELSGKDGGMKITRMESSVIDQSVKALEGKAFFDWMAKKVEEMLERGEEGYGSQGSAPLRMGLSWSFPIDQTSTRSGRVIAMGKGFLCSNGTVGDDLNDLIMEACSKRNLNVRMDAIVNDSSSTLLSRAYADPSTRMSLILGTGTNAAVHYPVNAIGIEKYGDRPPQWFAEAKNVIVNTELSMFGGGVLTMTRWDDDLNRTHLRPDYQPLEYMITGRYLGEIVRLIIAETVQVAGLFGGQLPSSMSTPYSFDTSIVASFEDDTSPQLEKSSAFLQKHHQFTTPPSHSDLMFIQKVSQCVSRRAAAYLATAIHGLWCVRNERESPILPSTPDSVSNNDTLETLKLPTTIDTQKPADVQVTIACDGTVINKYPNFRRQCQDYLNQLTAETENTPPLSPTDSDDATATSKPALSSITLDPAHESAIFGAAVAVAIS